MSTHSDSTTTLRSEYKQVWEMLQTNNVNEFREQFEALTPSEQLELVQEVNPLDGKSLLHIACSNEQSEIVDLLLRVIDNLHDDKRIGRLWHKDKEMLTPLHYACSKQRADIVRQLLRPPWPSPTDPNPPQSIPITATSSLLATDTTLEIIRDLLRHARGNPLHQFNSGFKDKFPSCRLPTGSLEDAVPIVVVGEKNAGKSTIIKSLQIEGASSRIYHLFRNVSGASQHKAGIVPIQVHQHSYLGRVVFYELSGNREFVHEAILEAGHLADAVFLIVINTREEIDVMTKQIVYWINFIRYCAAYHITDPQPPNIIVTGSHKDILPPGRFLAPNERFLLAFRRAREAVQDYRLITHLTSDFRKATAEVLRIQWKLYYELKRLRRHRPALPSICYILYSIIQDLCDQKKEKAITIHELFQELSTSLSKHYQLLPQDIEELMLYCVRLHDLNVLLLLKDNDHEQNSWIITDPRPLLDDIEEALFADRGDIIPAFQRPPDPTTPTAEIQASRLSLILTQQNSGVLERSELEEKFRNLPDPVTTNMELLIKVMIYFKYTDMIVLQQTPPKSTRPCFYIPHLLPRELQYDHWPLSDEDYTYIGTWAMIPKEFLYFMPHLVHKLLLHLSLSSVVPLHCSRSHRSLAWADPSSGVQVFISDHNSEALVCNIRCFKNKENECLKLRTTIIDKIRSLMAELNPKLSVCELLIPRSRVERKKIKLPVLNPLHPKLKYCNLENVLDSVRNGTDHVITSDPTTMVTLSDLLYFEPYSRVQKMPEELRAHLGDPEMEDTQITDQFLFELLKALGAGDDVDQVFMQFLKIVEVEVPLPTPLPDNIIDMAALASRILQGTGLTYSELRDYLDSLSIVKYSSLQW